MRDGLPVTLFRERTGLSSNDTSTLFGEADRLRPPRELAGIGRIVVLSDFHLTRILRAVPLRTDPARFPYGEARVRVRSVDPKRLRYGQKFAQRDKVGANDAEDLIGTTHCGLESKGRRPPIAVSGWDAQGTPMGALLLPPIVERHGDELVLLDGVHRAMSAAAKGETFLIVGVHPVRWGPTFEHGPFDEVELVDAKPKEEADRYHRLFPALFRDLDAVGIDG